jgi:hypothetical protein
MRAACTEESDWMERVSSLESQALLELRHAEAVGFHQLEAGDRTFGQALRSQAQARVVHLVGRHHDGLSAFSMLIGHVHLRELRHDGTAVLVAQVGIEHAPVGLTPHEEEGQCNRQQGHRAEAQLELLRRVHAGESLAEGAAVVRGLDVQFGNCGGAHGFGARVKWGRLQGGIHPVAVDYSVPLPRP